MAERRLKKECMILRWCRERYDRMGDDYAGRLFDKGSKPTSRGWGVAAGEIYEPVIFYEQYLRALR